MSIKIIIIFSLLMAFSSCSTEVEDAVSLEQQELNLLKNEKCEQGECPCETPKGNLAHGAVTSLYSSNEVQCEASCTEVEESFICSNGLLVPEGLSESLIDRTNDYTKDKHFSCTPKRCKPCVFGNTLIPHKGNVELYNTETVDCGLSCEDAKSVRQCLNGVLGGDESFDKVSCGPRVCRCQTPDASGYLSLGGKMDFYRKENAECGKTCDADYKLERECVSYGSGDSRTFTFSGSGSYRYQACENARPEDCYCNLPNYGGLTEGAAPIILYTKSTLYCNERVETFQKEFSCVGGEIYRNGVLYDPTTDSAAPSTRYYTSIHDRCTRCRTPWGQYIDIGEKVMAYKLVGATTDGGCGKGCKKQEQECIKPTEQYQTLGKLTGDPTYNKQQCDNLCYEEGGGAPPRACLLPWQNTFVTPGAKVPMWKKATVACGESCQDHFAVGTCQLETGTFDVGPEYIHKSCTELCVN
ncbi:MAG: hypothetical protein ACRBBP_07690 [Bdellovibrionales bacterium]